MIDFVVVSVWVWQSFGLFLFVYSHAAHPKLIIGVLAESALDFGVVGITPVSMRAASVLSFIFLSPFTMPDPNSF